ncbi:trans-sialidase protein [Marine Group I thaumarchaeote SCGC AAA799-N04]|uniref:Trans-sialidase protein n=1 Tax=Marine Group I thaumarchaeote SCGC AAA799-N04 TaxID=1502293 RepID=A0A081RKW2_9ARCH|nr:trans-sialidase protein [Marine Group I thaumarchaeote SCGC AAA799-N04]
MAAKRKASTKKDLEAKIAELEAKLSKLSSEIDTKPAETKQAEVKPAETKPAETKPAETKPAETKPAETAKPKATLPKGMGEKPAEAPEPQEAPKPAETTAQPPATPNEALESAYYDAPMSDFHQYRAKVTGYSPAPNRYFVRMTAPVGKVPTSDWNQQKATVTGYTACSNQYYATRARMAPRHIILQTKDLEALVE